MAHTRAERARFEVLNSGKIEIIVDILYLYSIIAASTKGIAMKPPSQEARLLAHLQTGAHITRLAALTELGIFELSARIKSLEAAGNVINRQTVTVINRWGEKTRVKEYWL